MVQTTGPLFSNEALGRIAAARPISSSFRNRRRRAEDPYTDPTPTPPTCDVIVSGAITPNATGEYYESAPYAGRPTYTRADGAYAIWQYYFAGRFYWVITTAVEDITEHVWKTFVVAAHALRHLPRKLQRDGRPNRHKPRPLNSETDAHCTHFNTPIANFPPEPPPPHTKPSEPF